MTQTSRPAPEWAAKFFDALARSGVVRQAAHEAKVHNYTPYARRQRDPAFAERWQEALARAKAARAAPPQPPAPVTGKPVDNWREVFFAELAATSNLARSAAAANVTEGRIYQLRRDDPQFGARWLAALHEGYDLLEMELLGYLRDPRPAGRMDVGGAHRVLAAHRAAVERRRLMTGEYDVEEVRQSIDAFLEGMRARRLANEALLLEAQGEQAQPAGAGRGDVAR